MKDSGWERFVNTGQVCDYLSYKGYYTIEDSVKNPYKADFSCTGLSQSVLDTKLQLSKKHES